MTTILVGPGDNKIIGRGDQGTAQHFPVTGVHPIKWKQKMCYYLFLVESRAGDSGGVE